MTKGFSTVNSMRVDSKATQVAAEATRLQERQDDKATRLQEHLDDKATRVQERLDDKATRVQERLEDIRLQERKEARSDLYIE